VDTEDGKGTNAGVDDVKLTGLSEHDGTNDKTENGTDKKNDFANVNKFEGSIAAVEIKGGESDPVINKA
jgi:hypothetical protein